MLYQKQCFGHFRNFRTVVIISVLIAICLQASNGADYKNHKIFKVFSADWRRTSLLLDLQRNGDDFWSPVGVNKSTILRLSPGRASKVLPLLVAEEIKFEVIDRDLQESIEAERRRRSKFINEKLQVRNDPFSWIGKEFVAYPTIVKWINSLPNRCEFCFVEEIGKSYEGRPIYVVKIQRKSSEKRKQVIFIDAGIHAREWLAPATAIYILDKFVKLAEDAQLSRLSLKFDWHFAVVLNPDGYEFTFINDRLWRKNRRPINDLCTGVDLNRNFDADFGGQGSTMDPCGPTFSGEKPFSEPESLALSRYLRAVMKKAEISLYVTLHSYGQLVLMPYSFSLTKSVNHNGVKNLADLAVDAIYSKTGAIYKSGRASEILYNASGSSMDWCVETLGIKFGLTFELRPGMINGSFIISPENIQVTGQEILHALTVMANSLSDD